jgi:hypothetical protein
MERKRAGPRDDHSGLTGSIASQRRPKERRVRAGARESRDQTKNRPGQRAIVQTFHRVCAASLNHCCCCPGTQLVRVDLSADLCRKAWQRGETKRVHVSEDEPSGQADNQQDAQCGAEKRSCGFRYRHCQSHAQRPLTHSHRDWISADNPTSEPLTASARVKAGGCWVQRLVGPCFSHRTSVQSCPGSIFHAASMCHVASLLFLVILY